VVVEHVDHLRLREDLPTPKEVAFTWSRRALAVLVDGRERARAPAVARELSGLGAILLCHDAIAPVNPHLLRRIRWVGRWDGGGVEAEAEDLAGQAAAPRGGGGLVDLPDALEVHDGGSTLGALRSGGAELEARGDWVELARSAQFRTLPGVAGDIRLEATLTADLTEHAAAGLALAGGPGRYDSIRLQLTGATYFSTRPGVWLVSQRGPVWFMPLVGRTWPAGAPVRLRLERRGDLILAACGPPGGPLTPLGGPLHFPTSHEVDVRLFAAQGRGERVRFERLTVQSRGRPLGTHDR
jgi:hypothetical protein